MSGIVAPSAQKHGLSLRGQPPGADRLQHRQVRNQPPSPSFSRHENSRRKLQHGPAGGGRPGCGGGRKWRYAGWAERQRAGPPRRSNNRVGAGQRSRATAICRPADHQRQRSAAGTNHRRAVRSQYQSARALDDTREPRLRNPAPPDAPCARCQAGTVAVLSPRAQKRGSYPPPPPHQLDSTKGV